MYLAHDPHEETHTYSQTEPYQDVPPYQNNYVAPDMDEDSMRIRSEDDLFAEDFRPVAQPQPVIEAQTRDGEQASVGRVRGGIIARGNNGGTRVSDRGRGR